MKHRMKGSSSLDSGTSERNTVTLKRRGANYGIYMFKSGTVFSGTYSDCVFSKAHLSHTIIEAKFRQCNFYGADMRHCKIQGQAAFRLCDLRETNFSSSHFDHVVFSECNLTNANLDGVSGLSTSIFTRCTGLATIKGISLYSPPGARATKIYLIPAAKKESDGVPRHIEREDTAKIVAPCTSFRHKPSEDITPVPLPPVSHYRSSPSRVPSWAGPRKNPTSLVKSGYPNAYSARGKEWDEKHKYGYMSNAVLECSDIDEFLGSKP
jgi:hypothetical protein